MTNILLVDDSPTIRRFYRHVFSTETDLRVAGEAPDPYAARELLVQLKPDVMVLDIEMPRLDGLSFLGAVMRHHPLPVVVCSGRSAAGTAEAMRALDLGATEVLAKPDATYSTQHFREDLVAAVRAAGHARRPVRHAPTGPALAMPPLLAGPAQRLIAVGVSTGGPAALEVILSEMPAASPGMVIVQHMPPGFTRSLAARLDAVSAMEVVEAEPGMKIQPGRALIAPGGSHVYVRQVRGALEVEVAPGPRVNGHCPSVDILFQSVHAALGGNAVGVLLTGMGRDGAEGLKRLRDAGATTLVQDEATSVVYGMAREAVELEAAEQIVPLGMLARHIVAAATGPSPQPGVARASVP